MGLVPAAAFPGPTRPEAEVCAEETERFLVEGFELARWYPARLQAALAGTTVRACFLGHRTFSAGDLASYRDPKPQHEGEASHAELNEAAAWIRLRSHQLREERGRAAIPGRRRSWLPRRRAAGAWPSARAHLADVWASGGSLGSRVGEPGPAILLSGHLRGTSPILVYRVEDYAATVRQLHERGMTLHELEIPHGPCASFTADGGQRYAVYSPCTNSFDLRQFTSSTAASTHKEPNANRRRGVLHHGSPPAQAFDHELPAGRNVLSCAERLFRL
jgi:hypothetical protein